MTHTDNIVIAMMARDEDDRIEAWLLYHASIVGYRNLFVIDNGSVSDKFKDILLKYEKLGVKVIRFFQDHYHFTIKGDIISKLFQNLNNQYDIFIPLDCDEFLVLKNNNGIVVDPSSISKYLLSFRDTNQVLLAKKAAANILGHPGYFFQEYDHNKIFFPKDTCISMDEGFHQAVPENKNIIETNILYLHFHYRKYNDMVVKSHNKLENIVITNNYNGAGFHVVQYLNIPIQNYLDRFNNCNSTHYPDFIKYLKKIGVDEQFIDSI